jgi:hypothetical protein
MVGAGEIVPLGSSALALAFSTSRLKVLLVTGERNGNDGYQ